MGELTCRENNFSLAPCSKSYLCKKIVRNSKVESKDSRKIFGRKNLAEINYIANAVFKRLKLILELSQWK